MRGDKGDKCQSTDLVPLRGEKLFGPHPQNRILVPFFKIFDDHPRHFYQYRGPNKSQLTRFKRNS